MSNQNQPATGQPDASQADSTRTLLRSSEFTCPSCVTKIEKQLARLPGVTSATVHFTTGRIQVDHDPATTSVQDLVAAVGRAGYRAAPTAF